MDEKETLGQRIRRIRQDRGLSLAKVVRDDFSRAFLNQFELGKSRPSIRVLRIIAERLGTEAEYLLEGQEAGIERELALERGRVLMLQGDPRRALLALIALGRKDEAAAIIARERSTIELHNDHHRRERLRTVERGDEFRFDGDAVDSHLRLADRATRAGNNHDELEHYRAARVLLEATPPRLREGGGEAGERG